MLLLRPASGLARIRSHKSHGEKEISIVPSYNMIRSLLDSLQCLSHAHSFTLSRPTVLDLQNRLLRRLHRFLGT